ncbi:hypothetical protein [Candidatus Microthrix parvicella]|jgi:hypothetical protein|uniref:hypothetical protein n=1 Tax=Candidatus Neomicrothrix parvicella TaxID=41950 RepID=UPI0004CE83D5|nr:hypothetical protein [Candidatus Microthrix parvicella]
MIKVPRASEASATPTGADLFADDDSLEAAAATRGWAAPARRSGRGGGRAGAAVGPVPSVPAVSPCKVARPNSGKPAKRVS